MGVIGMTLFIRRYLPGTMYSTFYSWRLMVDEDTQCVIEAPLLSEFEVEASLISNFFKGIMYRPRTPVLKAPLLLEPRQFTKAIKYLLTVLLPCYE
jgi:hypothetical protein